MVGVVVPLIYQNATPRIGLFILGMVVLSVTFLLGLSLLIYLNFIDNKSNTNRLKIELDFLTPLVEHSTSVYDKALLGTFTQDDTKQYLVTKDSLNKIYNIKMDQEKRDLPKWLYGIFLALFIFGLAIFLSAVVPVKIILEI